MECRSLELTLISAEGLKKPRSSNKTDKVYVKVTLTGYNGSLRTPTDKNNPEPIWNHPMQITVDETAGQKKRMLVFKIKAVRTFFDKNLGEVRLSFKELMEGMKDEGKDAQVVTYKVSRMSKKPGGTITFSYKFGPKFIKPVTVYATGTSGTSSSYAQSSSSGFGTGFLGGLVMADIISHAGHHGGGGGGCGGGDGGGCGGGGCGGGGCGGGGCGGGGCGGGGCGGGGCGGGS